MDIVEKARIFATAAHAAINQRRKYTNEPYINHPKAVVSLVQRVGHSPEMLAAAWLHDVVEDTQVTLLDLHHHFGHEIADLVGMLTNVSQNEGNRQARKYRELCHTAQASPEAKTIKLADLLHNTLDICAYDSTFAKVFMAEKKALLSVLHDGNKLLLHRAWVHVQNYEQQHDITL